MSNRSKMWDVGLWKVQAMRRGWMKRARGLWKGVQECAGEAGGHAGESPVCRVGCMRQGWVGNCVVARRGGEQPIQDSHAVMNVNHL